MPLTLGGVGVFFIIFGVAMCIIALFLWINESDAKKKHEIQTRLYEQDCAIKRRLDELKSQQIKICQTSRATFFSKQNHK
jgi:4-diphosphocytidyl-2C-methyl-D-erythritol kinase